MFKFGRNVVDRPRRLHSSTFRNSVIFKTTDFNQPKICTNPHFWTCHLQDLDSDSNSDMCDAIIRLMQKKKEKKKPLCIQGRRTENSSRYKGSFICTKSFNKLLNLWNAGARSCGPVNSLICKNCWPHMKGDWRVEPHNVPAPVKVRVSQEQSIKQKGLVINKALVVFPTTPMFISEAAVRSKQQAFGGTASVF